MIISEVISRLRASETFTDATEGRIYHGNLPQGGSRPAVLVNMLTSRPLDEISGQPTHDETILQVDLWVDGGEGALGILETLGLEFRRLFEGVRWTSGGLYVQGGSIERDNILHSQPTLGSDTWLRRRSLDLRLTHSNGITRA